MDVVTKGDGSFHLLWKDKEVAEARAAKVSLNVPKPPTLDEAELAVRHYLGFKKHYYPSCFVCGPKRDEGDALQIFPGQIGEEYKVVAPWMPDKSLADETGWVAPEFIWASLDCPGAFAAMLEFLSGNSIRNSGRRNCPTGQTRNILHCYGLGYC